MSVGNAALDEHLSFVCVLAVHQFVAFDGETKHGIYQRDCDLVQVDEQASCLGVNLQSLVQVASIVNLADHTDNDLADSVNFYMVRFKINLVVESFCDLEN